MTTILLVIQVMLALGIIFIVLIQRSENDGFGLGSGGGMGVISGRAKANLLTRSTAILAAAFMINSLLLTILTTQNSTSSLIDRLPDAPMAGEQMTPVEGDESVPVLETEAIPVEGDVDVAPAETPDQPAPVVPRAE